MATALESNKTKIARRVIEVFEFFAAGNCRATVMDIVRSYGRPQSSTSELLGSLVEMGLLYKDPQTRSYAPTPRLAALGLAAQPEGIGNLRLFDYMDQLARTSRCSVGLFGIVGTHAQVFRLAHGADMSAQAIGSGKGALLNSGAIGLLLLSSQGLAQASKILWRLNAESLESQRCDLNQMKEQVARMADCGHASGASGFAPDTSATALLLPEGVGERRLAIGAIYKTGSAVDPDALVASMRHGVGQALGGEADQPAGFTRNLVAV